jgi:ectoine hydrolase
MQAKLPSGPNMAFTMSEYAERLHKTRSAMQAAAIDVLIVSDPSNMAWLTGYDGWSFYVHQAVILGQSFNPIWFGRGQDAAGARRTTWLPETDIIGYPDNYVQSTERHPMDYLSERLIERGHRSARIGVEMDNYWFSAKAYAALRTGIPDAKFSDATALVNWQRAVKSEQELSYMRLAGRFVEKMHQRIYDVIEPGLPKSTLVAEIYDAGLRFDEEIGAGGDYPALVPLLPSGEDAAAPHLTWDDRPMKSGEGTFFEIAGVHKRYHCPLSRTIFLGTPSEEFINAEKAVLEGMNAGLEVARAGNLCEDIANAFFAVLARYGIEKNNRAGYPIGLSYPPDWGERTMSLRQGDKTELQPGMTFHFMTGLWMKDWGFEITESIVIGDGSVELLANYPRKMMVKS